ncbi:MAG: helix-turn-helix transcriptional regulator [Chloroflexales bacterium]|nr:helix-turn-helix transcriptional regulator [Chloroflexales bacterium]
MDALVGARIAEVRRAAGLTVRELAATLGWPHTTLNNYETGRRPIPLARLAAVARALHRPPASFLVETAEEADLIAAVAGNVERCLQVKLVLTALDDPMPGEDG